MSASSVGATDQLATPPAGPAPLVAEARQGRLGDLWRAVSRSKKAVVGALLLLFFTVLAAFPGQIAPYNPNREDLPAGARRRPQSTGSAPRPSGRTSSRS